MYIAKVNATFFKYIGYFKQYEHKIPYPMMVIVRERFLPCPNVMLK